MGPSGARDIRDGVSTWVHLGSPVYNAGGRGNSVQRTACDVTLTCAGCLRRAVIDTDIITLTAADSRATGGREIAGPGDGNGARQSFRGKRSRMDGEGNEMVGKWNEKDRRTVVGQSRWTWPGFTGWEKESLVVAGALGTEKGEKERDGEEITFDFELLGSVTLSLPRVCLVEAVAASFLLFLGQVRRYVTVPRVKAGPPMTPALPQVHDRSVPRATLWRIDRNRSTSPFLEETLGSLNVKRLTLRLLVADLKLRVSGIRIC